jgi:hypothetical protein
MRVSSVISLVICGGLATAIPVHTNDETDYSSIIQKQMEKRQDLGVIPGLPAGLAGFVPMIANMGILPSVVKNINCERFVLSFTPVALTR